MNAPERRFEVTGGDGHFDSNGRGVWVGHLLTIPLPAVPSISGSASFSTVQSRVSVGRSHRLRGVHFAASDGSSVDVETDPAADVYRHLPVPPPPVVALSSSAGPGNVNA